MWSDLYALIIIHLFIHYVMYHGILHEFKKDSGPQTDSVSLLFLIFYVLSSSKFQTQS
jgi:hypothetical protein